MKILFTRFVGDEFGVTSIEYGLIAALISVVCIAAMTAVGGQLKPSTLALAQPSQPLSKSED